MLFLNQKRTYTIDHFAFKLHYRVNALIFLAATALVTSRQYIGEHIRCIRDDGVPSNVMDTFYFFTATYSRKYLKIVKHLNSSMLNAKFIAHRGVGPVGPLGVNSEEPIRRHAYYQWVPFVLFAQALMFYFTHHLWKKLEGGRLRTLVEGLEFSAIAFGSKEMTVGSIKILAKKGYKLRDISKAFLRRLYISRTWALNLIVCEFLNCIHVVLQIFMTNSFLSEQFLNLGLGIIRNGLDSNVDVLDMVFAKVTKCTFHKYGPSGSIQSHDAIKGPQKLLMNGFRDIPCIINDKIYVMLWFWFGILFIISTIALLWRCLVFILYRRSQKFNEAMFSTSCPGKLNPWNGLRITRYDVTATLLIGYFFTIYQKIWMDLCLENYLKILRTILTVTSKILNYYRSKNARPLTLEACISVISKS
ncbi:hypothetical protein RI129_000803 [Pyrocoelia pectoralis]|uniref:Innexin n=1 Tax=Pyrocoelia pectoralis TaxID=417401 RepID=A0AAN7VW08_9COLE